MSIIKNVIKVERATVTQIGAVRVVGSENVILTSQYIRFAEICIKRPAKCEILVKEDAGESVFTTELTFDSAEKLSKGLFVWRLTTADGEQFLIGTHDKPRPQTTWQQTLPDTMTKSSLRTYKVTWTGKLPALLII